MTLPSFRAVGIARGVGGAATRQTKTQTSGPAPADRSVIGAVGLSGPCSDRHFAWRRRRVISGVRMIGRYVLSKPFRRRSRDRHGGQQEVVPASTFSSSARRIGFFSTVTRPLAWKSAKPLASRNIASP